MIMSIVQGLRQHAGYGSTQQVLNRQVSRAVEEVGVT